MTFFHLEGKCRITPLVAAAGQQEHPIARTTDLPVCKSCSSESASVTVLGIHQVSFISVGRVVPLDRLAASEARDAASSTL